MNARTAWLALASLSLVACPRVADTTASPAPAASSSAPAAAAASSAPPAASAPAAPKKNPARAIKGAPVTLDVRKDGKALASWELDGAMGARVWDLERGTPGAVLPTPPAEKDDPWMSVLWSPDAASLALVARHGVALVDPATGTTHRSTHMFVERWAWSPDGTRFLVGSDFDNVELLDAKTGRAVRRRPARNPNPAGVASPMDLSWHPDGTVAIVQQAGKDTELWDRKSGATRGRLAGGELQSSADGKLLVVATLLGGVQLVDAHTGATKQRPRPDRKGDQATPVSAFAISADGAILAWASDEGIEVWDAAKKAVAATLRRKDAPVVRHLALGPEGMVAFAADDGTAHLWDTKAGVAPVALGQCAEPAFGGDGRLSCVATEGKSESTVVFDGRTGARLSSSPRLPKGDGPVFVSSEDESRLVRRSDGRFILFREVVVEGKSVPIVVGDDGSYMGDPGAANLVLTEEMRERKSLVADFFAGR